MLLNSLYSFVTNRRDYLPAYLLSFQKCAAIAPYLNQSLIRELLNYQGDTWNRYGVKLWLLVSLEIWLQGNLADYR